MSDGLLEVVALLEVSVLLDVAAALDVLSGRCVELCSLLKVEFCFELAS